MLPKLQLSRAIGGKVFVGDDESLHTISTIHVAFRSMITPMVTASCVVSFKPACVPISTWYLGNVIHLPPDCPIEVMVPLS